MKAFKIKIQIPKQFRHRGTKWEGIFLKLPVIENPKKYFSVELMYRLFTKSQLHKSETKLEHLVNLQKVPWMDLKYYMLSKT